MVTWTTLGFDRQKTFFEQGFQSHAYLFVGQPAIGKHTFARELACNVAANEDILCVDGRNGIDEIRRVKNFLSLSALAGDYKIVVIDNADRMTTEAQNALLKILEEPSASSILLLIAPTADSVIPTISSRCQIIECSVPSKKDFFKHPAVQKLSNEQKEFLYQFSNGSIGLLGNDVSKIKTYVEEFARIASSDINYRFDVSKTLSTDELLQEKVLYWMLYLRTKKMYKPLKPLFSLYKSILHPEYREQLALENFMLEL